MMSILTLQSCNTSGGDYMDKRSYVMDNFTRPDKRHQNGMGIDANTFGLRSGRLRNACLDGEVEEYNRHSFIFIYIKVDLKMCLNNGSKIDVNEGGLTPGHLIRPA
jgi:hypothetical protein